MQIRITPSRAQGRILAPASKSAAHRALILAAFTDGVSNLSNLPLCDDVLATLDCLEALGARFTRNGTDITVHGKDLRSLSPFGTLPCRESASTLRLLIPIAAATEKTIVFSASDPLLRRPMLVYEELFARSGWLLQRTDRGYTVRGARLPDTIELRADLSSQFISGTLLAFAICGTGGRLLLSTAPSSRPYIDLTLEMLGKFGAKARWESEGEIVVHPSTLSPISICIEADHSAAANLEAFNLLGGEVLAEGLDENSRQADRVFKELFPLLEGDGAEIDLTHCPDLGPILFSLAAAKHGARFTSVSRLRTKECDRLRAMAQELSRLGARLSVGDDTLEVFPSELHAPSVPLDSHGDHRVAMALIPLLSIVGGSIRGVESIKKSFPEYLDKIRKLGIKAECE